MDSGLLNSSAHLNKVDGTRLYQLQVRELEEFALFLTSTDGEITTWNRGVEKAFGYSEEEWLGQRFPIIFTEEDRLAQVPEMEMQKAARQGRCADVRWHVRKDGARVYMRGVLIGLRDKAGTLIGYSKVCLDDTARKELEDALTESNLDLQQFACIASHDLQEPLRAVTSFSELLSRRYGGQLDADANEMLDYVMEASRRMGELVRDLLVYSQPSQKTADPVSIQLEEDLETAIRLLRTSIEEAHAIITHDPLPKVELKRNEMIRLFENLLSNAIKFRRRDEPLKIHVSAERHPEEWVISVTDNGIGFPPEHATLIFAPFQRLHTTEEYPGSGIGLTACKRIVERYKGRIGAESRPGHGATFWFTIPLSTSN